MNTFYIYFAFLFFMVGLLVGHTITEEHLTSCIVTLTGAVITLFLFEGFKQ